MSWRPKPKLSQVRATSHVRAAMHSGGIERGRGRERGTHEALHLLFIDGTHWSGGDGRNCATAGVGPQVGGWLNER